MRDFAAAGDCLPTTIAVDTSFADTTINIFEGRGWGEVFTATDTIVKSISVWAVPSPDPFVPPYRLYVTQVDSGGMPLYLQVLREGPLLNYGPPDSTRAFEMKFELSPPLVLPRPGQYFFAVKEVVCVSNFGFLACQQDVYPGGRAWMTGPILGCVALGPPRLRPGITDLVFSIEFCSDSSTATRRESWGDLKLRYR